MPPRRGRGPITFPPMVSHPDKTKYLSPSEAQPLVAKYVARSLKHAYCHPDSLLEPDGVQYGPKSGRTGGLVMHYLKRVEAGLRGEHLPVETLEELKARFGDDAVDGLLPKSDDRRLDETIRKKEAAGNLKRKRSTGEVLAWAENSSQPGQSPTSPAANETEWQPKDQWEQEQEEWIGEVGDREGASATNQNGSVPPIVQHDRNGNVHVPNANKTDRDKAAKKAAKKLKNKEEKKQREQARLAGGESAGGKDAATTVNKIETSTADQDEPMDDVTAVDKQAETDAVKKRKKLEKQKKKAMKKQQSNGIFKTEKGDD